MSETVQVKPAMGQTWKCTKHGCTHVLRKYAGEKWFDQSGLDINLVDLIAAKHIQFVSHPEPKVGQTWRYNETINTEAKTLGLPGKIRKIRSFRSDGETASCADEEGDAVLVPIQWFRAGYLDLIADVADAKPAPLACTNCRSTDATVAMRIVAWSEKIPLCSTCMLVREKKIALEMYDKDHPARPAPTVIVKSPRYDWRTLQAPWGSMRGELVCPVRGRRPLR